MLTLLFLFFTYLEVYDDHRWSIHISIIKEKAKLVRRPNKCSEWQIPTCYWMITQHVSIHGT